MFFLSRVSLLLCSLSDDIVLKEEAVVAIQTKHNEKVGGGDKVHMKEKEQSKFLR